MLSLDLVLHYLEILDGTLVQMEDIQIQLHFHQLKEHLEVKYKMFMKMQI